VRRALPGSDVRISCTTARLSHAGYGSVSGDKLAYRMARCPTGIAAIHSPDERDMSDASTDASMPSLSSDSLTSLAPAPAPRRSRRRLAGVLTVLALCAAAVWGTNILLVGRPVASALAADSRNVGLTLTAHYGYYVQPGTLVLDLTRVESASPADLWRATFAAAATLYAERRFFDRVLLARAGTPVFVLSGEDFKTIGLDARVGENPIYMVRTFPQRLHRPDGTAAYGTWEGGWLGVLNHQMRDVSDAANAWVDGGHS
jgi:hypothetical protein